jgi:Tfp pilus assembly protein PilO
MKLKTPYTFFVAILLVIVLGLFGAWCFFVYRSSALRGEIAALQSASDEVSAKESKLISLKNVMRDSKDDIDLISSRFIAKDDIPKFIDMLETDAQGANVKADLSSINLEDGEPSAIRALKVHVSGSGSWKDSVGFIALIESLPYALSVDSLSLSKTGDSGKNKSDTWNWNADITASVLH